MAGRKLLAFVLLLEMGTHGGIQEAMMPEDYSTMQTTVSHVILTLIVLVTASEGREGLDRT